MLNVKPLVLLPLALTRLESCTILLLTLLPLGSVPPESLALSGLLAAGTIVNADMDARKVER